MKSNYLKISSVLAVLFTMALSFQSCTDSCEEVYTYTMLEPVYMTYEELRTGITTEAPRALEDPGKIYFKQPYIFINEKSKGVHVIDNSNPRNPQNIAFINIPGNIDMAAKSNVLYVDNYVDLLTIDISDPQDAQLIERVEDVFTDNYQFVEEEGILVDFNPVEVVETYSCGEAPSIPGLPTPIDDVFIDDMIDIDLGDVVFGDVEGAPMPSPGSNNSPSVGIGGSQARFTVYGSYLYAVTNRELHSYSLADINSPLRTYQQTIGWDIETIFPFQRHLLIGSRTGMHVYNLDEPSAPAKVSVFTHARNCDPVVAEGDYAYVTLRTGSFCEGFNNQLDVVDIQDFANPHLVKSYPLHNPHGLGIDDGTLFICDGDDGLKVYNAEDPRRIDENEIAHFPEIHAFDVIPYNNTLFMIGSDGFYQYRYTDEEIILLSHIVVGE